MKPILIVLKLIKKILEFIKKYLSVVLIAYKFNLYSVKHHSLFFLVTWIKWEQSSYLANVKTAKSKARFYF